jgi:hypothetical protein
MDNNLNFISGICLIFSLLFIAPTINHNSPLGNLKISSPALEEANATPFGDLGDSDRWKLDPRLGIESAPIDEWNLGSGGPGGGGNIPPPPDPIYPRPVVTWNEGEVVGMKHCLKVTKEYYDDTITTSEYTSKWGCDQVMLCENEDKSTFYAVALTNPECSTPWDGTLSE